RSFLSGTVPTVPPAAYPRVLHSHRLAPPRTKRAFFRKRAQRAGPALPSYLALHHAGFSVPPMSPPERWALTPPFHPCLTLHAFWRRSGFPARLPPCCAPPAVSSLWHFP